MQEDSLIKLEFFSSNSSFIKAFQKTFWQTIQGDNGQWVIPTVDNSVHIVRSRCSESQLELTFPSLFQMMLRKD